MNAEGGDDLARGFRNVDSGAAEKLASCLEYLDSLPEFRQYKRAILAFMNPQPGSVVADLGCGLGFDVQRLAALVGAGGRAIGVDASLRLIESARAASTGVASAEFIQADIQKLPFANGVLQSCKVDRTLQHVEQPALVLEEMFRTIRAGGTAVCAEPDWGTFGIEFSGSDGEQSITGQIISIWTEGFRNPRIGRELRLRLEQAGFVDVRTQDFVLATPNFESSDRVFDLAESAQRLARVTASNEPLAWLSHLRECGERVRCWVTLIVHLAHRP